MSGNLWVDVAIALIGAFGLIASAWLTYKGTRVGKTDSPPLIDHGSEHGEHSRTRDFIAREHDETRRQAQDGLREIRDAHDRLLTAVLVRRDDR